MYLVVVISNHTHLLLQAKDSNLSDILRDFKKYTSQRITDAILSNEQESRKRWLLWLLTREKASEEKPASYRFWQPDNHAEMLYPAFHLAEVAIHPQQSGKGGYR